MRFICSVFEEMRVCQKTHNYSYLESLIEEAQILANRMESSLEDQHFLKNLNNKIKKAKKKLKKLEEELEKHED